MLLHKSWHLSYCTNIHPGESWDEVFSSLRDHLPDLKRKLSPDTPFGVGLRLSDKASRELVKTEKLAIFKEWLEQEELYVYTMNGFPFGGFHHQEVKDNVHKPDWTTRDRLDYTLRLAHILAALLPEGIEGGISTSPLSYKPWFSSSDQLSTVFTHATENLIELTEHLLHLRESTGKHIHIDIEPEPDGLLENSEEVIRFYRDWLLPKGTEQIIRTTGLTKQQAKEAILAHIQLCYDVCHFALAYEAPQEAFAKLSEAGIRIGKIQLSSALKVKMPPDRQGKEALDARLKPFAESTYLHQVVAQNATGHLTHFTDLHVALETIQEGDAAEWRIHYHVPLFTDSYNGLQSTQDDVEKVLSLLEQKHITSHLEVETYTWEVLPDGLKVNLIQSIQRELEWVINTLNRTQHAKNGSHQRSGTYTVADR